jgi:hypothetical protein
MPQAVEVPQFLLLPEVKVLKWTQDRYGSQNIWAEKTATMEAAQNAQQPLRFFTITDGFVFTTNLYMAKMFGFTFINVAFIANNAGNLLLNQYRE